MTTEVVSTRGISVGRARPLVAYVVTGLGWFVVVKLALAVRVSSKLWAPAAEWAWLQALGVERLEYVGLNFKGVLLVLYGVIAAILWLAVELLGRRESPHYWRRALIAWAVFQVCVWLLLNQLAERGILAE